jgi:hypothetical protein
MTKKPSERVMKTNTIFREVDEMLAGVHGELTEGEIIDRTADMIGRSGTPAAAWLVRHAQWHRDRCGTHFGGRPVTQAEAAARGLQRLKRIEVYQTKHMDAWLTVRADGTMILHTRLDGFPSVLRPPEIRDEVVDMADVEHLDGQHPGKRLVELVKAALAELQREAAA